MKRDWGQDVKYWLIETPDIERIERPWRRFGNVLGAMQSTHTPTPVLIDRSLLDVTKEGTLVHTDRNLSSKHYNFIIIIINISSQIMVRDVISGCRHIQLIGH